MRGFCNPNIAKIETNGFECEIPLVLVITYFTMNVFGSRRLDEYVTCSKYYIVILSGYTPHSSHKIEFRNWAKGIEE